jgi:hypothetical protein
MGLILGAEASGGIELPTNVNHTQSAGDLSCIFLLHRYQLFWVCFCSHRMAVFSYFSIATSAAERRR